MDFDKTTLIGNTLQEYDLLGYPDVEQAFYVQCSTCTDNFEANPRDAKLCSDLADGIRLEYESRFGELSRETSTRAGSMTDATTIETTGMNTPIVIDDDHDYTPTSRKRKMQESHGFDLPFSPASKKGRVGF